LAAGRGLSYSTDGEINTNQRRTIMKLTRIISALFAMLVCAGLAQAQSDHTFVSAHGADNSDCGSSDLPCRSFKFALTKTNAGGEVVALDSGIYDDLTIVITKSATLAAAPGAHVEIAHDSPIGIQVNASTSDTVVLRHLYLGGKFGPPTTVAIQALGVGTLHIENCVVNGFDRGIDFTLSASAQASIQDSSIRGCGQGIGVASSAGTLKVSIDHCRMQDSVNDGLFVFSHARVTVRDSVAAGNGGAGFLIVGGDLNIENCEASNNRDGVAASGNANTTGTVTASTCIVTNNSQYGFRQDNGGVFQSLGNNTVRRNGTNITGTINTISAT
jgi:hypothetical protein